MRYAEFMDGEGDPPTDRCPAPFDMIEKSFAIRARDLARAVTWFAPEVASGEARWPVVHGRIIAVTFDFATDAVRFAAAACGRPRWRSADQTAVYLRGGARIDIDPAAEMSWTEDRVDQLGMRDRCEIHDGVIIDCTFRRPELASAFADALHSGDLSLQDDPAASDNPGKGGAIL